MKISDLDKNLLTPGIPADAEVELHNIAEPPFRVHGVILTDDGIVRMPHSVAPLVSAGVGVLYRHTAGGRIRFRTDSPYLVISASARSLGFMEHMAHVGSSGFDVYVGDKFVDGFVGLWRPDGDIYRYLAIRQIHGTGDVTVNMPLYNELSEVSIGIARGATLAPPEGEYALGTPVVYYGSSITQGGCASRPGNSYQGFLSRWLNIDHLNLGFSGNAHGERVMAEYIASLDMAAFVLDYDHNAPTVEHLASTHKPFFDVIRAAHPNLPIIMMGRPICDLLPDDARTAVIRATYDAAIAAGDRNVYLVTGCRLMALAGDEGTVDHCHPTDLGFFSMARALLPVLRTALGLQ